MGKRLFAADKRAEYILTNLKAQDTNLSSYISGSIVDETLPVFSRLYVEALYLLDFAIDGAQDWSGNKLIIATGQDELEFYTRQTLGRGIAWLMSGHHIKKCDVLKDLVNYFHQDPRTGGTDGSNINPHCAQKIKEMREMLSEIDPNRNFYLKGLGGVASDVLDYWEYLWDKDEAYDILITLCWQENLIKKIEPLAAIKMLQRMENQFIHEAINDVKK